MCGHIFRALALFLLLAASPAALHAQVAQIVFTTSAQSITPGTLSGPITIQAQDSSGASVQVPETLDLEFLSTSPTGEFLGSTGNPATKTMNKNTANRTFYYQDSTPGAFSLTVSATGRDSGDTWSATQAMVVSGTATGSPSSTSTPSGGTTTSGEEEEEETELRLSSHFNSSPVSTVTEKQAVLVGGWRDRLGSVGAPLEFFAILGEGRARRASFRWNFGDGTEEVGQRVVHVYEHPGEYVAVLTATLSGRVYTARMNVTVVDPELEVVSVSEDGIEIRNNSDVEVNLYGRALSASDEFFIFPKDTIVREGKSIFFPSDATGLETRSEYDVSIVALGDAKSSSVARRKVEEYKTEKIAEIEQELAVLEEKRLAMLEKQKSRSYTETSPAQEEALALEGDDTDLGSSEGFLEASTISALDDGGESWLQKIKRFFFGTR